jgi:hypothetical protein
MKLYDPVEERRQHRRDTSIEAVAAACGLLGAWLLATKSQHAPWAWWAFLASNIGWIAFGWIRRHWFLLLQQVGFTGSSLVGIWTWMGGGRG